MHLSKVIDAVLFSLLNLHTPYHSFRSTAGLGIDQTLLESLNSTYYALLQERDSYRAQDFEHRNLFEYKLVV